MPRQTGAYVENNFSSGLVTEATALNFPENGVIETYDTIFDKVGHATRRPGWEYEDSYSLDALTAGRSTSAVSSFLWKGAGGDGNVNYHVQQVGQYIYFYAIGDALSAGLDATTIDLSDFVVAGASNPYSHRCSFTAGLGKLFVVGKHIDAFYVEDDLTGTDIGVEVRDTVGSLVGEASIAYPYPEDERPVLTATTVDDNHLYNLYNHGWFKDVIETGATKVNPLDDWDGALTTLPSLADRWYSFRDTSDRFDTGEVDKFTIGGTAPGGHFIWSAWNIQRNDVIAAGSRYVTGSSDGPAQPCTNAVNTTSGTERPQSVAFFANRVFYAGIDADGYNGNIYYSQLLTDITLAGKCYQEWDPTHEAFFDLLATDGGWLAVPEIGNIYHMEAVGSNLIIFCSNGIWTITGSEGVGFTALDFTVAKHSPLPCSKNKSYVNVNGVPAWVTGQGIWLFSKDEALGSAGITSLTERTIRTFFEEIPTSAIPYIKGVYNQQDRKIYWFYRSTSTDSVDDNYNYDRCLVFDTETKAFYPFTLSTDSTVKMIDAGISQGFSAVITSGSVSVGADDVYYDNLTTAITTDITTSTSIAGSLKVYLDVSGSTTFGELSDGDYIDWTTAKGTGTAFSSYFTTGYRVDGDSHRDFQDNYVTITSKTMTGAGYKMQGIWDYGGTSTSSNRWSTLQQCYKHDANYEYTQRKLKVRGHGKAVQFRFESEAGKPFNMSGWAVWVTSNQGI